MKKNTFTYVLNSIQHRLQKEDLVGDVVPPRTRLAVFLFRLCRGEYFYSIAEQFGIGKIVKNLR